MDPRDTHRGRERSPSPAPFAQAIGRTRYVVLLGVAAVLLVAVALFVLGAGLAVVGVWKAFQAVLQGDPTSTSLTVDFLEIVSTMLKAVVFYLVGVGLYSLFIAPLNLTVALGMETLHDVESKVVSVVILIMAITFLEHFILWQDPVNTLLFGTTLALVVAVLVLFQFHSQRVREEQRRDEGDTQLRAQQQLFQHSQERDERESPADSRAGRGSPSERA